MFNEQLLITRQKKYSHNIENSEFYHFLVTDIFDRLQHLDNNFNEILSIGNGYDAPLGAGKSAKHSINFCNNHLNISNYTQKFDLIIFPFMLHFISNPQYFLQQIYDLLKDNGIFICNFAGANSLKKLRDLLTDIESQTQSNHYPHIIPFIQLASVPELLKHAGFEENITDMESLELEYDSPIDLMRAIKNIGQNNILLKGSYYAINKKMYKLLQTKYNQIFTDKVNLITFIASKKRGTIKIR